MISLAKNTLPDVQPPIVQIRDISESERIPAKFLEQILLTLKNAGLLHSKMGVGGGYYLARNPQDITLGQVFRVLDGPIAPVKCVSRMAYESCDCPDQETCGLRLGCAQCRRGYFGWHLAGGCDPAGGSPPPAAGERIVLLIK
jgi:Rrf2 family protein